MKEKSLRAKMLHDYRGHLRSVQMILELAENNFNFATQEGAELLEEAKQSFERIDTLLEKHLQNKETIIHFQS